MIKQGDGGPLRFCPRCAEPLESRILKAGDLPRLVCKACDFVFYLDPKVAVGTIIRVSDDEIVLCRRAIDPGYGRWVFPGGYVDRGEQLEEAAIREAREECGLEVRLDGLVSLHSHQGHTTVVIVYGATAIGGTLKVSDEESLEVGTFTADTIPWSSLAFDSTHEALGAYFGIRPQLRLARHDAAAPPRAGGERKP
jgi:8-oxo-dGTP diphosphatase